MWIAIGLGISFVIFVIVRSLRAKPSGQLFNLVLGALTLECLFSLSRLWSQYPIGIAMTGLTVLAGTVGLVLNHTGDDVRNYPALACYGALLILLNRIVK